MGLLDIQRTPPMFDIASILDSANPDAQQQQAPPSPEGAPPAQPPMPPVQYAAPAPGQSGPAQIGGPVANDLAGPRASLLPPPPHEATHMNFLQRFNNHLSNTLVGEDAPSGYEGVLSPDEIKHAKPGWIHSLIGGEGALSPQHQWEANLNGVLARKQLATGMGQQRQVQAVRQAVGQIPLPDFKDADSVKEYYQKVYTLSAMGHDEETLKTLTPLMEKFAVPAPKGFVPQLFVNKKTGEQQWMAPEPGKPVGADWSKVSTASGGTPTLWRGPQPNQFVTIAPGDQAAIDKYAKQGFKPDLDARTSEVQGNINSRFETGNVVKGINDFRKDVNKDLGKAATVLNQSLLTIRDARDNPNENVRKVLFSSAIANFIQAADPKAQVRWQLLNYFKENINASAADRLKLLVTRLKDGTLPPSVLDGMVKHLEKVRGLIGNEIDARRASYAKTRPDLAEHLPERSEWFPEEDTTTPTTGADALYKKFNLAPKPGTP